MAVYNPSGEIRAAGGVVVASGPDGLRVLLVHRPAYDDWSLPKGKLKRGEKARRAAVREVAEETGLLCDPAARAGEMHYLDRKERPKCAEYWVLLPRGGEARPAQEVDRCEWLDLSRAAYHVSRPGDRELLAMLTGRLRHTEVAGELRITVSAYTIVHEREEDADSTAG